MPNSPKSDPIDYYEKNAVLIEDNSSRRQNRRINAAFSDQNQDSDTLEQQKEDEDEDDYEETIVNMGDSM